MRNGRGTPGVTFFSPRPRSKASLYRIIETRSGVHYSCMNVVPYGRLRTISLPGLPESSEIFWHKTVKAFRYVWANHRYDADWFMKVYRDPGNDNARIFSVVVTVIILEFR